MFVRRHPPSHRTRVVSRSEVVVAGLRVPFLAGELVVVRVAAVEVHLAAVRIVIRILEDGGEGGVGDHAGGAEVVGEVVLQRSLARVGGGSRVVDAGEAASVEEDVFGGEVEVEVALAEDRAAGAVPIDGARASDVLHHAVAVAVVNVGGGVDGC